MPKHRQPPTSRWPGMIRRAHDQAQRLPQPSREPSPRMEASFIAQQRAARRQAAGALLSAIGQRDGRSQLEQLYRAAPLAATIWIGILAGWSPGDVQTLTAILAPVFLLQGRSPGRA
jgi:hypothetical protein